MLGWILNLGFGATEVVPAASIPITKRIEIILSAESREVFLDPEDRDITLLPNDREITL